MALSGGQKFALFMAVLGCAALCAGSAAPFWKSFEVLTIKYGYGLWYFCIDDTCEIYNWLDSKIGDFEVWFYLVHVCAGIATIMSVALAFVALGKLCSDQANSVSGTGFASMSAGLLGAGAAVVYYMKPVESLSVLATALLDKDDHDWAFYVFAAGSGVLLLFGIVLMALPSPNANSVRPY